MHMPPRLHLPLTLTLTLTLTLSAGWYDGGRTVERAQPRRTRHMARLHVHLLLTPLILALALRTMNTSDSHLDQIPLPHYHPHRLPLRIRIPRILPRRTSSRDRIPLAIAVYERLFILVLSLTFTRTRATPFLQLPSLRFLDLQAQLDLLHRAYPQNLPQSPHPNPSKTPINLHTPRFPLPILLPVSLSVQAPQITHPRIDSNRRLGRPVILLFEQGRTRAA
ncbi:hypothetical protein DFP72DRAFT_868633 [Ephemerocybe angulata]|uniref:Secreted protein n=1 Tax=Ephemerocybe angulata TaxID=980116 RepID=A0A8H6IJ47_9AGAR|nr:hypothetical protein DFP72DRAFT_868633 [Tulosesus angulatus]